MIEKTIIRIEEISANCVSDWSMVSSTKQEFTNPTQGMGWWHTLLTSMLLKQRHKDVDSWVAWLPKQGSLSLLSLKKLCKTGQRVS